MDAGWAQWVRKAEIHSEEAFLRFLFWRQGLLCLRLVLTLKWLKHVLLCRKAQLHFCAGPGIDPGFVREFSRHMHGLRPLVSKLGRTVRWGLCRVGTVSCYFSQDDQEVHAGTITI